MAEFKVNRRKLTDEISAFRSAGEDINDGYREISNSGVSTLKTANEIIAQHESLNSLLDWYKMLILRDARDLDDMVDEASRMDSAISTAHRT